MCRQIYIHGRREAYVVKVAGGRVEVEDIGRACKAACDLQSSEVMPGGVFPASSERTNLLLAG